VWAESLAKQEEKKKKEIRIVTAHIFIGKYKNINK
jgi:hypothetical protein